MSFRTFRTSAALCKLASAAFLLLGVVLVGCSTSEDDIPPTGLKLTPEPAEKDRTCYLFAYRPESLPKYSDPYDPSEAEQICYAVSTNGKRFFPLNDGMPVLDSKDISNSGGIHDPYLMRNEDGGFYMVAADVCYYPNYNSLPARLVRKMTTGWIIDPSPFDYPYITKNRGLVLMKSDDLIHWSSSAVDFPSRFPMMPGMKNLSYVQIPRVIYDPEAKKYLVYFLLGINNKEMIFGGYANADFTDFESEPQIIYDLKGLRMSLPNAEIIRHDGKYNMFIVDQDEDSRSGMKCLVSDTLFPGKWEEAEMSGIPFPYSKIKEGSFIKKSGFFRIANNDKFLYFGYDTRNRCGGVCEYNNGLMMFHIPTFDPDNGTVVPIARSELNALLKTWGKPDGFELPKRNNPIIEAFYADPGTLYSEKTGKYYIYPTHDGFPGWGGKDFQVFSSSDLKEWKFERTILTLGEDVTWSDGNAWAPCIMERKQPDGSFKYYFYFCGALKGDGRKCIGCAVADDPLGPFVDTGRPVIDFKPEGVRGGQEIDPDVFHDPVSGKYYLYWGNGYMAGGELADDMLSVKRDTVKVFRPGRTFREGTNVIFRDGKYYFSWSVDDTGSPNYHVRYATADSPLGDLTVPRDNIVIEKDPELGILGTGHHQILKVHGTDDEWRIVYHRFAWQENGRIMDGPGFHREVCIDKLEFNPDGSIRKVVPTL